MSCRLEVIGADHAQAQNNLQLEIDRLTAARSFIDQVRLEGPITARIVSGANGSISIRVAPLGAGEEGPTMFAVVAQLLERIISTITQKCRSCGRPRRRGSLFCSPECFTAWRVQDAASRGYEVE